MPKFKPGQSGNPKGRPKGSPNRLSCEMKERIELIIDGLLEGLEEDLQKVSPNKRLKFFLALLEFILPKLKRIELKEDSRDLEIPVSLWDNLNGK